MALGRVVLPRRAIAATSAREGEKARNVQSSYVVCLKSSTNLGLDVFLVVDHDSDLKNRCSTGRFRAIAIHILSLTGGSTVLLESELDLSVHPGAREVRVRDPESPEELAADALAVARLGRRWSARAGAWPLRPVAVHNT